MRDHTRDYCTAAFRFFAQHKRGKQATTDQEQKDIEAASQALDELERTYGRSSLEAVKMVYFKDCHMDLRKGDIDSRVHYACIHIPASEKTIYRWLAKARSLFSEKRGLRL